MQILKYTKCEGGEWIEPVGEFTEEDVLSMPLWFKWDRGFLWGYIHSYIIADGARKDAYNNGANICE